MTHSPFRAFVIAAAAAMLSGCIAGAASDSPMYIYQAQRYPAYLARSMTKVSAPLSLGVEASLRQQLLSGFPEFTVIPQTSDVRRFSEVGGLQISFLQKAISVRRGDVQLLDEQLPQVFHHSDLQSASHTMHGERVHLLLAYSRQSTSMVWLGLYDAHWKPLYRAVRPRLEVWSLQPHTDGVLINGSGYAELIRPTP